MPLSRARRLTALLVTCCAVLLLAYAVLVGTVLPRWAQGHAPAWLTQQLGVPVDFAAIRIDPFDLTLTLGGLTVGQPEAARLQVRQVWVDLTWTSLFKGVPTLVQVQAEGADLKLVRMADGSVRLPWQGPKPADSNDGLPAFVLRQANVRDSRLTFEDRSGVNTVALTLDRLSAQVSGLDSRASTPARFSVTARGQDNAHVATEGTVLLAPLQAEGTLKLDRVQVASLWPLARTLPALAVPVGILTATAHWRYAEAGGKAALNNAAVNGAAATNPVADNAAVNNPLASNALAENAAADQRSANDPKADSASANVRSSFVASELQGVIEGLRLAAEGDRGAPLAQIDRVSFKGGGVDTRARKVQVATVTLEQGHVQLSVSADGRFNWQQALLGQSGAAEQAGRVMAQVKAAAQVGPLGVEAVGAATAQAVPWQWSLSSIALNEVQVELTHAAYTPPVAYDIALHRAQLQGLASSTPSTAVTTAQGRKAELGAAALPVSLELNASVVPRPEAVQATAGDTVAAARGGLAQAPVRAIAPAGSLSATLKSGADFRTLRGEIAFDDIALRPLRAVMARFVDLDLRAGRAAGRVQLGLQLGLRQAASAANAPTISVDADGMLRLSDVRINEAQIDEPLFGWHTLTVNGMKLRTEGDGQLLVTEVVIEQPQTRLQIDAQRQVNLAQVLSSNLGSDGRARAERTVAKGEAAPPGQARGGNASGTQVPLVPQVPQVQDTKNAQANQQAAPVGRNTAPAVGGLAATREAQAAAVQVAAAADDAPVAAAPRFKVRVDRVVFRDGVLDYSDASLVLPFAARIGRVNGTLVGLANDPAQRARVQARGVIPPFGSASVDGAIAMADPKRYTDVKVLFANVQMPALSPYTATFAGRKVAKGRLWLDLDYRIDRSALLGDNRVRLSEFELGERVQGTSRFDVPLDLAVALLRLPDGTIDVTVPIRGTLTDPKFSVLEAAGTAITGMLGRLVMAPFTALGRLLQGDGVPQGVDESLARLDFEPGSARLQAESRDKLTRLASALRLRPGLKVIVPAPFDAARDSAALKDTALRRALDRALGRAPVDPLRSEPAEVRRVERVSTGVGEAAGLGGGFDGPRPEPIVYEDPRTQQALRTLLQERGGADAFDKIARAMAAPAAQAARSRGLGANGGKGTAARADSMETPVGAASAPAPDARNAAAANRDGAPGARETAELYRQVADRLAAATPIPQARLDELAAARAGAVQRFLAQLGLAEDSIAMADVKAVSGDRNQPVQARLALTTPGDSS